MRKGLWVLLACVILSSTAMVYAQDVATLEDNAQITKAVQAVMKYSDSETIKQNMKLFSSALVAQKVPQDVADELIGKIETKQFDEISVEIFKKYFTVQDAKVMNEYYESPVGKKLLEVRMSLWKEYSKKSSDIYLKFYEEAFNELEKKGYQLDNLRKAYLNPNPTAQIVRPLPAGPTIDKK